MKARNLTSEERIAPDDDIRLTYRNQAERENKPANKNHKKQATGQAGVHRHSSTASSLYWPYAGYSCSPEGPPTRLADQHAYPGWADHRVGCECFSLLDATLRRIRRWRVPPNWTRAGWLEEMKATGLLASVKALHDYDDRRGIPFAGFLYQRILTNTLTRFRQEWSFAYRCLPCDHDLARKHFTHPVTNNSRVHYLPLYQVLGRLTKDDRQLIEQLFWYGCTEAEVARAAGISQPAVSKQKQKALTKLRLELCDPERPTLPRGYKKADLMHIHATEPFQPKAGTNLCG